MTSTTRIYYTAEQRARSGTGGSKVILCTISPRSFDRSHSSIRGMIARVGRIRLSRITQETARRPQWNTNFAPAGAMQWSPDRLASNTHRNHWLPDRKTAPKSVPGMATSE